MRTILQTLFVGLLMGSPGFIKADHHEDTLNIEQLAQAFGWDLEGAEIQSQKVADGLYVLFGIGGNIAVSIGEDGVLIVDDQFPQVMDKIEAAISKIGEGRLIMQLTLIGTLTTQKATMPWGPKGQPLLRTAMQEQICSKAAS